MKSLLTGATGFIGSFIAEALLKKGHEVTCLVRQTSNLRWIRHLDVMYLHADLGDVPAYSGALRQFDYIFHLAGLTKASEERDFFHANAECTQKLIDAVVQTRADLKRFVYVSSLAAAGPSCAGIPRTEEMPPHPVSAYGKSKLAGEEAVNICRDTVPLTIIRPPAVYGPRDADFFLVFKAVQNRIFPDWGESTYSLIHVADLVKGIIGASETGKTLGKTYYVADSRIYSNDDILAALCNVLGRKVFRLRLPRRILPVVAAVAQKIQKKGIINPDKIKEIRYPHWTCDPSRASADFGFHADTSLESGFYETAEWYRKEKWL